MSVETEQLERASLILQVGRALGVAIVENAPEGDDRARALALVDEAVAVAVDAIRPGLTPPLPSHPTG